MARELQLGRRIPIGEESTVLPLTGGELQPTTIEQDGLAQTLDGIERDPSGALPQISVESFLTEEEAGIGGLDLATQQIITQGQQRRAEEAFAQRPQFRPTVTPIQAGTITTPFLGTTPIFTGGGVRLSIVERRNALIDEAAGKTVGKPSDEELSIPFQNERQFRRIAARSNIDATNAAFAEAIAAGVSVQDVAAVLADPNNKFGRKLQQARSDIEVLAIEGTGLDKRAKEIEKASIDPKKWVSPKALRLSREILAGIPDILEGLGQGNLSTILEEFAIEESVMEMINTSILPQLDVDVSESAIRIAKGVSSNIADFFETLETTSLSEEALDAIIDGVAADKPEVVDRVGREKIKQIVRGKIKEGVRRNWKIVKQPDASVIKKEQEGVIPSFIERQLTTLGENLGFTETGAFQSSTIRKKKNFMTAGLLGLTIKTKDEVKFIGYNDQQGIIDATIDFFQDDLKADGITLTPAEAKQIFVSQPELTENIIKSLTSRITDADADPLLSGLRLIAENPEEVSVQDAIAFNILTKGSNAVGEFAVTGINRLEIQEDPDEPIRNAFSNEINLLSGETRRGILVPNKFIEAKDIRKEDEDKIVNVQKGDEFTFMPLMYIESEDGKSFELAFLSGEKVLDKNDKTIAFPKDIISLPYIDEFKENASSLKRSPIITEETGTVQGIGRDANQRISQSKPKAKKEEKGVISKFAAQRFKGVSTQVLLQEFTDDEIDEMLRTGQIELQ